MHEVLRPDGAVDVGPHGVRVVRAAEVASLRRSSPDRAIVALARSSCPEEAVAAQLAGADVVLPCVDGEEPSPELLAAACSAARVLAGRAAVQREETRRAAHEIAGNASAVAMAAQLLAAEAPARSRQLQSLAGQGAELAWRAGRAARSGSGPLEPLDLAAVVRSLCRVARSGDVVPTVRVDGATGAHVLVDRVRFARAITSVLANARRAGSASIEVRVRRDGSDAVEVVVTDDGHGLPAGWDAGAALRPFATGWEVPGDGLGLTEAAEFAVDHGGGLTVEPDPAGSGARVRLRLPVAPPGPVPAGAPLVPPVGEADWSVVRILEGIARRDPLAHSLDALVTAMEQRLPGSVCSILLLDQAAGTLLHGAGERLPEPYRAEIDGVRIGPFAGSCGTAAFTRSEVIAADIGTDVRWADYRTVALRHGLRSCWSTPILDVDRGIVLGTFAVYHATSWTPDAAATELVQRLTHVAAVAIGTAELHEQLVESEARFRSTFETAGLGIALVDPGGRIQQANAALTAMAGRRVTGLRLVDVVDADDARAIEDAMADALDPAGGTGSAAVTDRLPPAEVRLWVTGREEPLWAALGGSLVRGHDGEPRLFCLELFDLTERRRVAQARRERAVAEAANHAKSDLLALVSHELRTPLNAVIGFAQLLGAAALTEQQQRDGVGHILGAGRHLLRLINDLIDLTGAETGQLRLAAEPVALSGVVGEALEIVAGLAVERGVELDAPDGGAAHWVRADRQRLLQVLLNLLGNAIKFTPPGGRVTVGVERGAVRVTDTGPGIGPDHLDRLFTPFHRASDTGAEGSGLGLALSQRLTAAMGGRLAVESVVGSGSTFRVELAACPPERDGSAGPVDPVPAHAPRGRVLYLEDDGASRQLLASALSRWPAVSLGLARTCAEARSLLGEHPVDLLVIDVELPDGNGWDLVRELADRDHGVPPAVVVTAGGRTAPPGMEAVPVLGKPLVIDEVLAAISRQLPAPAPS
ncbi:GAF domain-containing protein [Pseudonocardia sp. KRD-184]|uniref:histidine kinase n=1 Tax=Pseudonocardia oceani TaxID=2792013 RepID=A0ABS6UA04_9PSEU|nr:ATP-binding protein [Pseudonocardia oceani]MBW0090484.1 GAF domain-containing protein [Pseudonocardia oceani]MBW0097688.1 GAF domain-containing protein [Pseudonocardia oceani]MBW0110237.1 GAF domain-containing protein [Pseudonocardia oceani]MBW0124342.1 GAF domain-containing protein [Pseudonocardia oceani]MBW0129033.1 GAF domain-containing protein [Pseudonocardia oceani]